MRRQHLSVGDRMLEPGRDAKQIPLDSPRSSDRSPTDPSAVSFVDHGNNDVEPAQFWGYSAELVSSELAPPWSLSPFILTGYRKQITFKECLASIFVLHNETGSIMTHLIGLLVFLGLLIRDLFFRDLPAHHRLLHAALLMGAQYCMGTSTAYHVVLPISQKTSDLALNCDMSGIAMCIITIFLVGLRYAFWCHEDLGHAYMCVVGIWSLLLFALPQVQWFTRLHKYAVPFLYFGFVVFALVPLIHWAVLVGGIFRYSFRLFLVP
jgi:adiponectin receptor